jgi:hypothetical protein
MFRALTVAAAAALTLAACAPALGPPPRGRPGGLPPTSSSTFRAEDFAWSTESGRGGIAGHLAFRAGKVRYSCAKTAVILTPETPWTRRRMEVLYLSGESAALPADEVRTRTPSAPSGDYSAFIRKATCDMNNRFVFTGLPDGAWYVIAAAKPVAGPGPTMAVMRRVVTRGGKVVTLEL